MCNTTGTPRRKRRTSKKEDNTIMGDKGEEHEGPGGRISPAGGEGDARTPNTKEHSEAGGVVGPSDTTSTEDVDPSLYANWPLKDIKDPSPNDVLYGRGGGTNHHPGNKRYRKWVEDKKVEYVNSKRLDKPIVALDIVKRWREQTPPGRFLKLDERTGMWNDVGDKKAREKTSQALREKAPLIRKELEKESGGGDEDEERTKKTTFDVPEGGGKPRSKKDLNHLMLARDHSLGRDYLQPGENVDVGDFDWTEPVEKLPPPPPPPPPPHARGHYRTSAGSGSAGWGSGQFAYIEPPSVKSPRSPHSPHSQSSPSTDGGGYDPRYPPPPPLPGRDVKPLSSSSFPGPPRGHYPYPPGAGASFPPPPPGSVAPRDHSLAGYPLRDASISSSARDSFNSGSDRERSRSYDEGSWQGGQYGPPPYGYEYPPPPYHGRSPSHSPSRGMPPPPSPYGPPPPGYHPSYGYPSHSAFSRADDRDSSPNKSDIPPPPMPPQQWSGQPDDFQRVADIMGQEEQADAHRQKRNQSTRSDASGGGDGRGPAKPKGGLRRKISGGGVIPSPPQVNFDDQRSSMARPQPVKRDTSHQCENEETKRRVQRSRLARDHSLAGVALSGGDVEHEALPPREYEFSDPSSHAPSEKSEGDAEVRALSASMRQSSLAGVAGENINVGNGDSRPPKLSREQRLSTVDAVRMAFTGDDDLEGMSGANKCNEDPNIQKVHDGAVTAEVLAGGKPDPLTPLDRVTTSDALTFHLESDPSILDVAKKPLPLAEDSRLSTGNTVDHIIASVEETVQGVGAELSSDLDSAVGGLAKPLSISESGRSTTADSILAPAGADDIANEWLAHDAEMS